MIDDGRDKEANASVETSSNQQQCKRNVPSNLGDKADSRTNVPDFTLDEDKTLVEEPAAVIGKEETMTTKTSSCQHEHRAKCKRMSSNTPVAGICQSDSTLSPKKKHTSISKERNMPGMGQRVAVYGSNDDEYCQVS